MPPRRLQRHGGPPHRGPADAAPTDPTNLHIQAICNATLDDGGTVSKGTGVLEQMIIGKHEPSGFKQTLDMAP